MMETDKEEMTIEQMQRRLSEIHDFSEEKAEMRARSIVERT